MRTLSVVALTLAIFFSFSLHAQNAQSRTAAPQTARQALIEMFFGEAPDHVERHLPDVTRKAFESLNGADGQSYLRAFSLMATQAKSGPEKLETFDTGSTLVSVKELPGGTYDEVDITVEGDSFSGDEDQIDLAVHLSKAGKEQTLPFIPRFTFTMKMESDVWRLNEISVGIRLPLTDPAFLNGLLERQRTQNEQMTQGSVRSVISAETAYHGANGEYACALSALGGANGPGHGRNYLHDSQLISGKKSGYVWAITGCDSSHYRIVAEPAAAGSGERAFCADESGTLRAASDGKAATCLSSGEVVEQPKITVRVPASPQSSASAPGAGPSATSQATLRARISQGVAAGLLVNRVDPIYPPEARAARIQGTVVLRALIAQTGDIESLSLISGHPMLAPAAIEAVKQWKYKPYLLNGKPVVVDTEVQVNFTLLGTPQGVPQN